MKLEQVFDRSLKMDPVVETRTQHHLAVQLNAGAGQALDFFHQSIVFSVAQQDRSKFRLGRVNRNVERRQSLVDDAPHLRFVYVREREVIAEQERETIVLILD